MTNRPLPEAIRGSWYVVSEEGTLNGVLEGDGGLLALHIDGHFVHYELEEGGARTVADEGDYTFDGDFLILRGDKTHTYRVHPEHHWQWRLEGKKKSPSLYRGLLEAADFVELPTEIAAQIARFPMRVRVECPLADKADAIFDLVYRADDVEHRIGTFSVEYDSELDALWVGLTPLALGLDKDVFKAVIAESYLKLSPYSPEDVERVTVEILGADDLR